MIPTAKTEAETGLDYFGARYFSGAQGRFTTVDPSMLSAVMANPQSWNRYTYALNNPLRYVDPNGELWVASGNASNPYSWVDECQKNQTCYENAAAVIGTSVRVYGSRNAQDITNYAGNENGVVNVASLAGHADARFEVAGGQRYPEEYLAPTQAPALFNVARDYRAAYPNDNELVFTAGSAASGGPALNAAGEPVHRSHQHGANIDMRYMGSTGAALVGGTAAANGDVTRMQRLFQLFGSANAGLGAALTGDPARYGLGAIDANLQRIHDNHVHFQSNYPPPPRREEPRIRPGVR